MLTAEFICNVWQNQVHFTSKSVSQVNSCLFRNMCNCETSDIIAYFNVLDSLQPCFSFL